MSASTPAPAAPEASPVTVVVEGRLTIHHAADVHARLGAALDAAALGPDGTPVVLALEEVTEMDTAGLQLLLWATREARGRGVPLAVASSPAVDAVLRAAGVGTAAPGTEGA